MARFPQTETLHNLYVNGIHTSRKKKVIYYSKAEKLIKLIITQTTERSQDLKGTTLSNDHQGCQGVLALTLDTGPCGECLSTICASK